MYICIYVYIYVCIYIYIYIYISIFNIDILLLTGTLAQRLECSPMARETWVQSQVESYQRL